MEVQAWSASLLFASAGSHCRFFISPHLDTDTNGGAPVAPQDMMIVLPSAVLRGYLCGASFSGLLF